eukprot:363864-Chlamydomonas_euryale.AAC.19
MDMYNAHAQHLRAYIQARVETHGSGLHAHPSFVTCASRKLFSATGASWDERRARTSPTTACRAAATRAGVLTQRDSLRTAAPRRRPAMVDCACGFSCASCTCLGDKREKVRTGAKALCSAKSELYACDDAYSCGKQNAAAPSLSFRVAWACGRRKCPSRCVLLIMPHDEQEDRPYGFSEIYMLRGMPTLPDSDSWLAVTTMWHVAHATAVPHATCHHCASACDHHNACMLGSELGSTLDVCGWLARRRVRLAARVQPISGKKRGLGHERIKAFSTYGCVVQILVLGVKSSVRFADATRGTHALN